MAEYLYRCVMVRTDDYGDNHGVGTVRSVARLSIIPDGSHWQDCPSTLEIGVPAGTRPGALYRVCIEEVCEDAQEIHHG